MTHIKALVLTGYGLNCDYETDYSLKLAGADSRRVHINELIAGKKEPAGIRLEDYHILVFGGGFSWADDHGAGVLMAAKMKHHLGEELNAFVQDGNLIIGICNGFQALVKAGYLPGPAPRQRVTLTRNRRGHFECRWVRLRAAAEGRSLFTRGLQQDILCPVAHGEGRLAVPDEAGRQGLWREGLVALTYVASEGAVAGAAGYPHNPNGSVDDIAGLCNAQGNVFGLMPHPEDHVFPQQHPRWTRGQAGGLGLPLFANGVRAAAEFV